MTRNFQSLKPLFGSIFFFAATFGPLSAGVLPQPVAAPEWEISEWVNGDPGRLADHKNRIVLIDFFQLWCPGCNQFSVPLFLRWEEKYGHRNDVLIVSIHTVFEGHDDQTPARLRDYVRRTGILHPVGIDAYAPDDAETPITMKRYETSGTPQIAIVDKFGRLRFNHFGSFDPDTVEAFIDRLLKEESDAAASPLVLAEPSIPEAEPEPEIDLARLRSGSYRMTFEQTSKSCGPVIQPLETSVDLRIKNKQMLARFSDAFIDQKALNLSYVEADASFSGKINRRIRRGTFGLTVELEIEGRFLDRTEKPAFEFEMRMSKTADEPGWDCDVEARGTGRMVEQGGGSGRPRGGRTRDDRRTIGPTADPDASIQKKKKKDD